MNQRLYLVSTWKNVYETGSPVNKNVLDVLLDIYRGTYQKEISTIRLTDNKEKRNKLKNQLLSVYFSGVFANRKEKSIIRHTGLICLDIDEISPEKLKKVKELLKNDAYAMAYFVSPSGNGLKVLVKIPPIIDHHLFSYLALERYFKAEYQITLDKSCKNINRFCFISYDNQMHIHKHSKVFTELWKPRKPIQTVKLEHKANEVHKRNYPTWITANSPMIDKLDLAAKLMESKFVEGNKHTATGTFALYCNRMGINKEDAEDYFYSNFPKKRCNAFQQEYKNISRWNTWQWKSNR